MSDDKYVETEATYSEIHEWQQDLLKQVMRVLFIIAVPALALGIYYVVSDGNLVFAPLYIALFLILAVVRFWKRVSYSVQVGTLLALIYGLAILAVTRAGLGSNVRLFLLAMPFVAAIFLGKRAGLIAVAVSMLTMLFFAALFSTGQMMVAEDVQVMSHKAEAWLSYSLNLLLANMLVIASLNYLLPRLNAALGQSRAMAQAFEAQRRRAELEAQRSRVQAERMVWAAAFGNSLTWLLQRERVVWRVVREMAKELNLYQVNLFLADRQGTTLSWVAASGEEGESWVREGWQISVGERSLLGRVAQSGQEQLVVLPPEASQRFPLSRVEVALPLIVRGEIFGILDIHSAEAAFSEEDLQLFRVVAGYVSASLETARLLEETEARIQEMRALYAQYTVASWRSLLEVQEIQSFSEGMVPADKIRQWATPALEEQTSRSTLLDDKETYLLVVPLIARDVPLGYLAFTRAVQKGDWDRETCLFIETAAERLALALDNTRLLVETRRQAFYQEQLGRIDDIVWGNSSIEAIMRQSVQELGRFLGANEAQLYVTPSPPEIQSHRVLQSQTEEK